MARSIRVPRCEQSSVHCVHNGMPDTARPKDVTSGRPSATKQQTRTQLGCRLLESLLLRLAQPREAKQDGNARQPVHVRASTKSARVAAQDDKDDEPQHALRAGAELNETAVLDLDRSANK